MKLLGTMTGNIDHSAETCRDEQVETSIPRHFKFAGNEALKRKRSLPPIVPSLTTPITLLNARPNSATLSPCSNKRIPTCEEKTNPQAISPVDYLRSMLRNAEGANSSRNNLHRIYFSKPSEEEMAAYDLDVVNAIRSRDLTRLRTLRDEGKSFNACNRFGESLLHMACRRGDLGVVTFLVEEVGVRLDVRDDYGRTALHDACWTTSPNCDVMDVLIQVFPSETLLAEDVRGHTPFDYARKEHWIDWIEFLQERKEYILKKRGTAVKVVA